jgi:hypothetical protein
VARAVGRVVQRALAAQAQAQAHEHAATAARAASKRRRKGPKQPRPPWPGAEVDAVGGLEPGRGSDDRAREREVSQGALDDDKYERGNEEEEDGDSDEGSEGGNGSGARVGLVAGLGGAVHRRAVALLPTGRLDGDWVEGAFGSVGLGMDDGGGGGGTLQTLLGMRETLASVQNGLGDAVELCEKVKNLLNWTHPQRTRAVLAAASLLSLVLSFVPFRYLLLAGGTFEFTKVWLLADHAAPKPPPSAAEEEAAAAEEKAFAASAAASGAQVAAAAPPKKGFLPDNFLATVPSDEMLRLAYAHEAKVNFGLSNATLLQPSINRCRGNLRGTNLHCHFSRPIPPPEGAN